MEESEFIGAIQFQRIVQILGLFEFMESINQEFQYASRRMDGQTNGRTARKFD